jgi:hypothetical protein
MWSSVNSENFLCNSFRTWHLKKLEKQKISKIKGLHDNFWRSHDKLIVLCWEYLYTPLLDAMDNKVQCEQEFFYWIFVRRMRVYGRKCTSLVLVLMKKRNQHSHLHHPNVHWMIIFILSGMSRFKYRMNHNRNVDIYEITNDCSFSNYFIDLCNNYLHHKKLLPSLSWRGKTVNGKWLKWILMSEIIYQLL